jgi:hypothetical protein
MMRELEGRAEALAGTFKAEEVANTLWAYTTMGRVPGAGLMRGLEGWSEALKGTFNTRETSTILWCLATLDTAFYETGLWTWISKAIDAIVDDDQEIDMRDLSMILQAYTRASRDPVQTKRLIESKMFPLIDRRGTHGIDTGTLIRWVGYVTHIRRSTSYYVMQVEDNIMKLLTKIEDRMLTGQPISLDKTCLLMRTCKHAPPLSGATRTLVTSIVHNALSQPGRRPFVMLSIAHSLLLMDMPDRNHTLDDHEEENHMVRLYAPIKMSKLVFMRRVLWPQLDDKNVAFMNECWDNAISKETFEARALYLKHRLVAAAMVADTHCCFVCPMQSEFKECMRDPVIATDGFSYEHRLKSGCVRKAKKPSRR